MVTIIGNGHRFTISHSANALGKSMNPTLFSPAMNK